MSAEELRRRCSPPESFSANAIVAYVRKGKGQKEAIVQNLRRAKVEPSPRIKLSTNITKLCEGNCKDSYKLGWLQEIYSALVHIPYTIFFW